VPSGLTRVLWRSGTTGETCFHAAWHKRRGNSSGSNVDSLPHTAAKLPAIEDQDGFMFDGMPINEALIGLPPPARISWPAGDLPVLAPRPPAKPGSAIF